MMKRTLALSLLTLSLVACAPDEPRALGLAATTLKVGSVQYGGPPSSVDASCDDDTCAVEKLVEAAAAQGALLVVAPEYGLAQTYLEPTPMAGDDPATLAGAGPLTKRFSAQAKQLKIYLVIDLQTYESSGSAKPKHNTQLAFGPDGKVVGVHHKFELFASEASSLTPGTDVAAFASPLGTVGLLICADLYGDLRLHRKLTEQLGARVIAVSSMWTAPGAPMWPAHFAKNWGVHVVSSNTTSGVGRGGGVFAPDGKALALHESPTNAVTVAAIPAP